MGLRMLAFAIGRVEEQRRRRARTGEWPLIADIEPALAKAGVHNRPVLVLPVPGARTGTGVPSRSVRRDRPSSGTTATGTIAPLATAAFGNSCRRHRNSWLL